MIIDALFKPLSFFLLPPTRPTGLFFPLQNGPRSLRQHQTGFHTIDSHHLEMFLISALWSLGLCLLLESFLLGNREVSYPPEHCCAVRKTMFSSNAFSSFITTLRRVETKQVKSVLVVYLLPALQKGLTVSTHTWTLMRPLVFVLHRLQNPLFALFILCFWALRWSVSQMLIATCS